MPARAPWPRKSGRPELRSMGSEVPIGMLTAELLPMRILLLLGDANHQSRSHVARILNPARVGVEQKLGGKSEAAEGIHLGRVLPEQDLAERELSARSSTWN